MSIDDSPLSPGLLRSTPILVNMHTQARPTHNPRRDKRGQSISHIRDECTVRNKAALRAMVNYSLNLGLLAATFNVRVRFTRSRRRTTRSARSTLATKSPRVQTLPVKLKASLTNRQLGNACYIGPMLRWKP